MTKDLNLITIATGYYSTGTLNANFDSIQASLNNTLSRDGSTPNTMEADLDLNNNDILNVRNLSLNSLVLAGSNVASLASVPSWRGVWGTTLSYFVNDLVQESGSSYICVTAHTSGTWATDLSNGYWELVAEKGNTGAGAGDLISTNNLSDLTDADTALANLGATATGEGIFKANAAADVRTLISVVPNVDVMPFDEGLASIASLTPATNRIPFFTGANTAGLLAFVDDDTMATNSSTALPSQQSVKAYVDGKLTSSGIQVINTGDTFVPNQGNQLETFSATAATALGANYVYAIPFELDNDMVETIKNIILNVDSHAGAPQQRFSIYERTGTKTMGDRLAYTSLHTSTSGSGFGSNYPSLVSEIALTRGHYWIVTQSTGAPIWKLGTPQRVAWQEQTGDGVLGIYYGLRSDATSPSGWTAGSIPPASGAATSFSGYATPLPLLTLRT